MEFFVDDKGTLTVPLKGRMYQIHNTNSSYKQIWDILHDESMEEALKESALKEFLTVRGCNQCGGNVYLKLNLEKNGHAGFCLDCLAELVDIGLEAIKKEELSYE